jgi:hypothetical protein
MSRVEDEPRRKIKDKCIYGSYKQKLRFRFRFMVFNTTFNNISVILWRSVLLVEETRVPRENHRLVASLTNFITWCCIEYTSTWTGFELTTLVEIDTDSICSCKSNYHTITATTAPLNIVTLLNWYNIPVHVYLLLLIRSRFYCIAASWRRKKSLIPNRETEAVPYMI